MRFWPRRAPSPAQRQEEEDQANLALAQEDEAFALELGLVTTFFNVHRPSGPHVRTNWGPGRYGEYRHLVPAHFYERS